MKKVIFLFMLLFVLFACSNDDEKKEPDPSGPFNVVFSTGTGGGTAPETQQVERNGTVTLPGIGSMTAPTDAQFAGWETGGWFYTQGKTFTITKDMTFTAVWMKAPAQRSYTSIPYVTNDKQTNAHRLGLWLPESGVGPFPVVLYVTGGAFVSSGHGQPPGYYASARARGYAVASVEHRVNGTPNDGGKFPNQIVDVLAAIRFLKANAQTYNLDPNRFAITGHSAGGYHTHMVAVLSNSPDGLARLDPDNVLDSLGNPGVPTNVLAAVSWAGLSDWSVLTAQHQESIAAGYISSMAFPHDGPGDPGAQMLALSGESVTGLHDPILADRLFRSNPVNYVHYDMAPLISQCSRDDNTVPYQQSVILADKIKEVCGEDTDRFRLDVINGQGHNTLQSVTIDGVQNMTLVMDFIESHMKK